MDPKSPYDELINQVNFLLKAHKDLQTQLLKSYEFIRENQDRITELERKLSPENPGDIKTLY